MLSSNSPVKIPLPFANSGTKNTIPTASQIGITPGAASLNDGFPPLNFTPLAAGGIPPFGADFNGILNRITAIQQWQNAGGLFAYDAAQSAAIGGYPKGALLVKADSTGYWVNQVENNTSNPDAAGAGWADALAGRLINVQVLSSTGTFTRTAGATSGLVRLVGGGAGGSGSLATSAGQVSLGAGGQSGAYGEHYFRGNLPASQAYTVGAVGAGGAAGGAGGAGGTTTFGALTAPGGLASPAAGVGAPPVLIGANTSAVQATGCNVINGVNQGGAFALAVGTGGFVSGGGASSPFGGGALPNVTGSAPGQPAVSPGAGGAGASGGPSSAAFAGGNGGAGLIVVYEFT